MFAVPGWSLETAALRPQADASKQNQSGATGANGTPQSDSRSMKRKRDDRVTKSNVDEMYRRHIEGLKPAPKGQKGDRKQKKDQKPKNADAQGPADKRDEQQDQELKQQPEEKPEEGEKPVSKRQRKNKNKKQEQQQEQPQDGEGASNGASTADALPVAPPKTEAILTPLQQAMRQKLISSRFRHLNETLYTTPSAKALELFSANPELFDEYHAGFARQVKESWPSNPVDGYIKAFRGRGAVAPRRGNKPDNKRGPAFALPRRPNGLCTVADLGCGDAQLARALQPSAKKLNLKLLSYDLHAPKDSPITKADISNLPLADGSVDVAVFCLSLMGTNWVSFVEEAWRVLRSDGKGECWVSEVKSRFGKVTRKKAQIGAKKPQELTKSERKKLKKIQSGEEEGSDAEDAEVFAEDARPTSNNDETDISAFVEVFRTRGFSLKPESVDKSNKMFVRMEFVKHGAPSKGKHVSTAPASSGPGKKRFIDRSLADKGMSAEEEAAVLKPCVYKIR
ncbi:hypothetical protein BO70DRAFT_362468 [Aspergillus heteromorphus CBS 117.55]|uniref:Ribosomal RNA-processing protein 8 n=1 Tax=Aspergillus heteromorphus CBS 117.55 TaxID=1448321 RepID=A0A317W1R2_9EURO|nr:uncharacterized protein BO70DRAFT_362468 [Aspergillus heteromorphus CBS 117.55]PWY80514.1 hypothetical protein BO70DRAFT_362468 [Aspergillus heteromorphus CBS 117.55]